MEERNCKLNTMTNPITTLNVVLSGNSRSAQNITATAAGQLTFVTGGYTVGLINVYLSGVRLVPLIDFTATDGTTITLNSIYATAVSVGSILVVEALASYAVANAISASTLSSGVGSGLVGFQQSVAGSVVRTVQDKSREILSVKDFGARGDGVTDDTTAIQAFLNSLTNKTGYIPSGTYKISTTLVTPTGNFSLYGDGATQSVILYTGTNTNIDIFQVFGTGGSGNIRIKGLGFRSNTAMTGGYAMHVQKVAMCWYEDLGFGNPYDSSRNLYNGLFLDEIDTQHLHGFNCWTSHDGITVAGYPPGTEYDIWITDGRITTGHDGVHIGGGIDNIYFDNCMVTACGRYGVFVDSSIYAYANGYISFGTGFAVEYSGSTGYFISDSRVNNPRFSVLIRGHSVWNGSSGVYVGIWPTGSIIIDGATLANNSGDGFGCDDTTAYVSISPATQIFNNSGYGLNAANANTSLPAPQRVYGNTLGNAGPNVLTSQQSLGQSITGTVYVNGNSYQPLQIVNNLTGNTTSIAAQANSTVQADVTNAATMFQTSPSTAASSFTLGTLYHFAARQGSIGAGSTVTNQYGFIATGSLTGATNNMGFVGNMTAGANNWNFYTLSSAKNYFNGHTLFATTTDNGVDQVQVSGSLAVVAAGFGLKVKEGSNAKQGTATLASGTVVVNNTSVTANSRIFLTAQDNNSVGTLRVSARTAGASFTITSSSNTDSGVVAYQIFEPA